MAGRPRARFTPRLEVGVGVAGGGVTIGPLAPKARVKSSAFWLTPEQLGETEHVSIDARWQGKGV